jgi:hypothetical protein
MDLIFYGFGHGSEYFGPRSKRQEKKIKKRSKRTIGFVDLKAYRKVVKKERRIAKRAARAQRKSLSSKSSIQG